MWSLSRVLLLSSRHWANLLRCTAPSRLQGERKTTPQMFSGWETLCHFSMQTPTSSKFLLAATLGRSWARWGREQFERVKCNDNEFTRGAAATPAWKMCSFPVHPPYALSQLNQYCCWITWLPATVENFKMNSWKKSCNQEQFHVLHDEVIKGERKAVRVCASDLIFMKPDKWIPFIHLTVLRKSSWPTWAPIDVLFYQEATRFCLTRGAFSWRVSSSPAPRHTKLQLQKQAQITWALTSVFKTLLNSLKSDSDHFFSGLPHFSVEPHHMSVVANVSLSLNCVAHGPPEPVSVIWLQDGVPLNTLTDPVALSPSTLNLTGITFHSALKATCRHLC